VGHSPIPSRGPRAVPVVAHLAVDQMGLDQRALTGGASPDPGRGERRLKPVSQSVTQSVDPVDRGGCQQLE